MNARDEDEVWRDIVENYGEAPPGDSLDQPAEVIQPDVTASEAAQDPDAWHPIPWEDEGRFVPPVPPPIPLAEPPRMLAWIGLFGAPTVLLVALIFGLHFPGWLSTLLVISFVGGFGFLVATMNTGPRDPGDDGARI